MRRIAVALFALQIGGSALAQPENFLILMADDIGIEKIKAFGEWQQLNLPMPITPKIDTLAAEGVMFRNVWSNPVCSPTRALALTGRYGFGTGIGQITGIQVDDDTPPGGMYKLPLGELLLPEILPASYSTAALGKWHLDAVTNQGPTSHPTDSGFGYHVGTVHNLGADFFTRTVGGQVQSFATSYFTYKKIGTQLVNGAKTGVFETQLVDGVSYPFYSVYANPFQPSADESNYSFPQRYATRDTAEEAIERIDGDGTGDLPEPWLLYVAFNAAHSPFHIPPSNLSPTSQVPASGRLYTLTTTLSSTPTEPELHRAMVESMDIEIGRILAAIPTAPTDVRARTTVIFVADNGSPSRTADVPFTASKVKGSLFEGGINVPFILRSPRLAITAANKGKQSTGLGTAADLFETVRDIANDFATGVGTGGGTDSRSLVPFAVDPNLGSENAIPDDNQHAFVYAENFKPNGLPSPDWDPTDPSQPAPPLPPLAKNPILPSFQDSYKRAIRGPRYKLIREHGLDARLYDLKTDPLESTNLLGETSLAQEQATLVTAMNALVGLPQRCSGGNDIDGDGYCDLGDKCVLIPDPDPDANRGTQTDTDDDDPDGPGGPLQAPDGYGNACDGDFDGSEHVAIGDFNTYKSCFEKVVPASGPADDPTCAEADMNSTGSVTIGDFNLFKRTFGKEPGPSCGFAEVPGCRGFPGL